MATTRIADHIHVYEISGCLRRHTGLQSLKAVRPRRRVALKWLPSAPLVMRTRYNRNQAARDYIATHPMVK